MAAVKANINWFIVKGVFPKRPFSPKLFNIWWGWHQSLFVGDKYSPFHASWLIRFKKQKWKLSPWKGLKLNSLRKYNASESFWVILSFHSDTPNFKTLKSYDQGFSMKSVKDIQIMF